MSGGITVGSSSDGSSRLAMILATRPGSSLGWNVGLLMCSRSLASLLLLLTLSGEIWVQTGFHWVPRLSRWVAQYLFDLFCMAVVDVVY